MQQIGPRGVQQVVGVQAGPLVEQRQTGYRRVVVRRERPAGSEIDLDRPTPAVPEPGPAELRTELAACLDPLLAQLPAIYRDALRLTDPDGLTQADAAALIGLSPAAARSSSTSAAASSLVDLVHWTSINSCAPGAAGDATRVAIGANSIRRMVRHQCPGPEPESLAGGRGPATLRIRRGRPGNISR